MTKNYNNATNSLITSGVYFTVSDSIVRQEQLIIEGHYTQFQINNEKNIVNSLEKISLSLYSYELTDWLDGEKSLKEKRYLVTLLN
jgi:hypothetical protein